MYTLSQWTNYNSCSVFFKAYKAYNVNLESIEKKIMIINQYSSYKKYTGCLF